MIPALLASLCALSAQLPEDPGPHAVGWRDVLLQDQRFGQGAVDVRIYYPALAAGEDQPADPAAGPYPVAGFQHGWLGSADGYDDLCTHLASWGFVVSSTDTERGLFPNTREFAEDTRAALWWVEDQSALPGSWLEGMADPAAPWAVIGHSMGGGTLSQLVPIEPRVRAVVGLQAAANSAGRAAMEAYDGGAWWIAGSADFVVAPATVHDWFERAGANSRRDLYWEVQGMGHVGCTDSPGGGDPLPGAEQHRLHRRLVGAVLRAEQKGEENVLFDALGAGAAGEPLELESACFEPPTWAIEGNASIALGAAARAGGAAGLAWSLSLGAFQTPYGMLGFDPAAAVVVFRGPAGAGGTVAALVPPEAGWVGRTVGFAAIAAGGGRPARLGRTVLVDYP
jgi:dienelactone hydrolase